MRKAVLGAVTALGLTTSAAVAGCNDDLEPCVLDGGSYHIQLPEGPVEGAIMFLHGWGSSGRASINNRRWVPDALTRGYAVIAPNGSERRPGRRGWNFHPDWPKTRDDVAFLQKVRDDASARFGLKPDRMMLGGFSIGGSMVHYLACAAPDAFFAYVPVGGAFWRPHPSECTRQVRLLHTHGWRDTTVPLEGRVLRGEDASDPAAVMQGDVFHAMDIWRQANKCMQLRGDRFDTGNDFWSRAWVRCAPGSALELALFPGGHTVPSGWGNLMLDWVESLQEQS